MSYRVDLSKYDQYLCLKPPVLLWIALVFLSRAVTLPVLVRLSSLAGGTADTTDFVRGAFDAYTALPSLIAAVVLYAFLRRSPKASNAVRWIWARGRMILAAAAALDFGLWFLDLPTGQGTGDAARVLVAALDVYFLVYILAARRVREVFAQFPGA
jgi:hypothetical protein